MTKKLICLLIAFMLVIPCLPTYAEETTNTELNQDSAQEQTADETGDAVPDPYLAGGLEMYRQMMLRYSNSVMSLSKRGEIDRDIMALTMPDANLPKSTESYPCGIVLDYDYHCVFVIAEDLSLLLMCSDGENSAEITAGYAFTNSYFCDANDYIDCWEHRDGTFTQLDASDAIRQWMLPYLDLAEDRTSLLWASKDHFGSIEMNTIGRIDALRGTACVIEEWDSEEGLTFSGLEDTILVDLDDDLIFVQGKDHTFLFQYAADQKDVALQWTVFNILMGGVELWDMDLVEFSINEAGETEVEWKSYDQIQELFDAFDLAWYISVFC